MLREDEESFSRNKLWVVQGRRISVKSVRRIVARGELKVHRIGNQIRVSPDDVAAYEKLHRE